VFCPAVTVAVVVSPVGADIAKSMPVPESGTFCGLSPALSVRVRNAVRVPDMIGVNVTLTLQVPAEATDELHVLVWVKSPSSAPVMPTLATFRACGPVLLIVTVCTALALFTVCVG
jgi:hypothetical protein